MTKKTRAKARRALLTLSLVMVMMVVAVGGTIAWLTSEVNEVTNTFTVGANVKITLDEADVYEEGETGATVTNLGKEKENAERVIANNYKLVPGYDYDKDPTVHVAADSGDCYVFVKVVNPFTALEANITDKPTIAAQMTANGWTQLNVDGADVANVFYYNKNNNSVVSIPEPAEGEQKVALDLVVFENFYTKSDLRTIESKYDNQTITVDAYAVQAEGFATAADAWKTVPTTAWVETPATGDETTGA